MSHHLCCCYLYLCVCVAGYHCSTMSCAFIMFAAFRVWSFLFFFFFFLYFINFYVLRLLGGMKFFGSDVGIS